MIDRKTTLLEIVDKFPETEVIIREYDKFVGVCLLCECLFDSIEEIEIAYNIDLQEMKALVDLYCNKIKGEKISDEE